MKTPGVFTNTDTQEQALRTELAHRVSRTIVSDGVVEVFDGVFLARSTRPMEPVYGVVNPSFCVVVQGAKEVTLGERKFIYDPWNYLLGCIEVPVAFRILEASVPVPYLGMRLNLTPAMIVSVMDELAQESGPQKADHQALKVSRLDLGLLEAVVRLVRLLDQSGDAAYMRKLITREIVYRLLTGEQGARIRSMTRMDAHATRIAQVAQHIQQQFTETLRVDDLARRINMSVSSFHQHFKDVTAMTPLQFQKQLRLREARRLMLAEHCDATTAGSHVGYDDASHFNRDYKRFFGAPPRRDVARIRASTASTVT